VKKKTGFIFFCFSLTVEPRYNAIQGTEKKSRYIEVNFKGFMIAGAKNDRVKSRFDCICKNYYFENCNKIFVIFEFCGAVQN
jgi:hypothetical protein